MYLRYLAGVFLLSFGFTSSTGQMDTSQVPTAIRSFVEYNGLNYSCNNLLSPGMGAFESLAVKYKDSAGMFEAAVEAQEIYRWLTCSIASNEKTIVVNIPSADVTVFQAGGKIFYSKAVVGKISTPTHTITSKLDEIILYPYWTVPNSIATKELLKEIKKDVAFLENGNYQVLDLKGRVVDPYAINWAELSKSNFPYRIRQSTGCDNSLGILKLNFYNPYSAYLHDTPDKALFDRRNRFYSHGCIRVQKAIELGDLILGDNSIAIDSIANKPCQANQKPVTVPVKSSINIFVVYSQFWPDDTGALAYYKNIYKRNKR